MGWVGYDTVGLVVVQAFEYVIENEKVFVKVGDDSKKWCKVVRKMLLMGFVSWGVLMYERFVVVELELLISSFVVILVMLLNLVVWLGNVFDYVRDLVEVIYECFEVKVAHIVYVDLLWVVLFVVGVVECLDVVDGEGHVVWVIDDLQLDFALNQLLSLFVLAVFQLFDLASLMYVLDMVSVVEVTLDDFWLVLFA